MGNTKEAILTAAIHLFAGSGYEAVSVSQIAGELGMTKGALYKHYRNKRDIFDHIIARMEEMDARQAENYDLPEGTVDEMEDRYRNVSIKQFAEYCKVQFADWTEDDFASSFRKMLTLEQFRNHEMQKLYQQYLAAGPMGYVSDLFRSLGVPDYEKQAAGVYGMMFLFYSLYDGAADKGKITEQFGKLLDRFMEDICNE